MYVLLTMTMILKYTVFPLLQDHPFCNEQFSSILLSQPSPSTIWPYTRGGLL